MNLNLNMGNVDYKSKMIYAVVVIILLVVLYFVFYNDSTKKTKKNKNKKNKTDETEEEKEDNISLTVTRIDCSEGKYDINIKKPNKFTNHKNNIVGKKYKVHHNDKVIEYEINEINCNDDVYVANIKYDGNNIDDIGLNVGKSINVKQ